MRAPAAIMLALALVPAASASAETVAQRTPAVGPALAGEAVAWGEETRGGVRVLRTAPGAPPALVYEAPAPTGGQTERGFMHVPGAFGASADAFAALLVTSTVQSADSDSVTSVVELAAVGGAFAGPAGLLSGALPEQVTGDCVGVSSGPDAVDADGPRVAVAESEGPCGPGEDRNWIAVHGPAGRVDVPVATSFRVDHVRLAGRYLAWIADAELVVHDLEKNAAVVRIRARDLGAHAIDDAALQPDGTVAFTFAGRRGTRLGVRTLASRRIRVLDRHASFRGIALAADRVLYERPLPRLRSELVLRRLDGRRGRTLARIPARRIRLGNLDLDATRATWATARRASDGRAEPAPGARGRIVLRSL